MDDDRTRKPWDQMEGEPDLWYGRFVAYLRMGTKRSVNAVFQEDQSAKNDENPRENVCLNAPGSWYEEAKKYRWAERAKSHDKYQRDEEDKIIAEEKEKVLRTGYALMHKRIEALNKLADKMMQWADEEDKVWLIKTQDVTSESFSKHTEETIFNAPLFTVLDKYFDSIAKEKGERVKKQEIDMTNTNDRDIQLMYEAIEKSLEQFPEAKIVLAEKLTEMQNEQSV